MKTTLDVFCIETGGEINIFNLKLSVPVTFHFLTAQMESYVQFLLNVNIALESCEKGV